MVKNKLEEVIVVRTWNGYVEESILIIFSVVLALFLTELFQKLHGNQQLREELVANQKAEEIQCATTCRF